MRKFFLLALLLHTLSGISQEWQKIDQSFFKMKYELPADWWVDGFGGDDWDAYGSSVCECAGTINGTDSPKIRMVIYPSEENGVADSKRQKVWSHVFQSSENEEQITAGKNKYSLTKSRWEDSDKEEVWQLITKKGKYYFIMYFWAEPAIMKSQEETILRILKSFN